MTKALITLRDNASSELEAALLKMLREAIAIHAPHVKVSDFARRIGYSELELSDFANGRRRLTTDAISDILLCMGLELTVSLH